MLRVWVGDKAVGVVDRHKSKGACFTYDTNVDSESVVSLTMPVRVASWNSDFGMLPVFEMNLPEGALREEIKRRFSKVLGTVDPHTLLELTGRSQIGRIRFASMDGSPEDDIPFSSVDEILKTKDNGDLYEHLIEKYIKHSGISGVQPKVMIRDDNWKNYERLSSTCRGTTHIVKFWNADEYSELAANEYFCLSVARSAGLDVPSFDLSVDGKALVIERFDRKRDGTYLGFEDFCVLNGVHSEDKYNGGYETKLFKRLCDFISPREQRAELKKLFTLFVLNCVLQNGDAHLKNFGLLYDHPNESVRLSPVFDIVTTTAYIPRDMMALSLNSSKAWPVERHLRQLGTVRARLSNKEVDEIFDDVFRAVHEVQPEMMKWFDDKNSDIGSKMLDAWGKGLRMSLGRDPEWIVKPEFRSMV